MAVDAARHVEVLNIMNASELVPSAARRFANVTDLNILSLVSVHVDEDSDKDTLSVGTATRSVPFLISFPKLKRAFIGGFFQDPYTEEREWEKITYINSSRNEPKNHLAIFRGLVDHLCGAFQSRSLIPNLQLQGVLEHGQLACDEEEDGHRCMRCWNIATSFPLELVLKRIPTSYDSGLCLKYSECVEALATRHDKPFLLQPQAVFKCFLAMTKAMINTGHVDSGNSIDNHFIARVKSQGGWYSRSGSVYFHFISVKDMEALKNLPTVLGPSVMKSVPRRELHSAVRPMFGAVKKGKKRVLVRQTFEGLVQLGFDLASKDFILIDPLDEDVLQSYHCLFRSEEEAS